MLACHQPPCPFLFLVRKTGFWPRLPRSLGRQGVFLSWQSAHGSMVRAEHSGTRHTKVLPMASEPQLPQRVQERTLLLQLIAPAPLLGSRTTWAAVTHCTVLPSPECLQWSWDPVSGSHSQ